MVSCGAEVTVLSVSSGFVCNFVAVCLTSVQFVLQVELCLYTTVQLLLEEFQIYLKSPPLSTQSHNTS